jgi:5'/3'-nucleotidase
MPTILITNDDGIDSPTLVPLARALQRVGQVCVVVPTTERSWIGKAISRFDVVNVHTVERDGISMHGVSGTPADCVSLGVHTLCKPRPDLVVSGVNLGLNFGLAFLLSSGTVGAVTEGWIAGVPGVAFSLAIPNDAYGLTGAHRVAALGQRPVAAAETAAQIVETLLQGGFPPMVDAFSVNMPADVTTATPRVVAAVTRSRYGPLFVLGPDGGYLHRFSSLSALESPADGDMQVVQRGAVAISPLRFDFSTAVPDATRNALERGVR